MIKKRRECSVIRAAIKDEYNRNLNTINDYENEIKKLPKGCLVISKRKNCSYVYLSFRDEQNKNVRKYVGKEESDKHILLKNQIRLRKYYSEVLKKLYLEKEEIELYLKVGDKLYE